ncbi:MAG: hypothetical protein Q9219_002632 [cf. Caloplaca sp. 3 TL-2023]
MDAQDEEVYRREMNENHNKQRNMYQQQDWGYDNPSHYWAERPFGHTRPDLYGPYNDQEQVRSEVYPGRTFLRSKYQGKRLLVQLMDECCQVIAAELYDRSLPSVGFIESLSDEEDEQAKVRIRRENVEAEKVRLEKVKEKRMMKILEQQRPERNMQDIAAQAKKGRGDSKTLELQREQKKTSDNITQTGSRYTYEEQQASNEHQVDLEMHLRDLNSEIIKIRKKMEVCEVMLKAVIKELRQLSHTTSALRRCLEIVDTSDKHELKQLRSEPYVYQMLQHY